MPRRWHAGAADLVPNAHEERSCHEHRVTRRRSCRPPPALAALAATPLLDHQPARGPTSRRTNGRWSARSAWAAKAPATPSRAARYGDVVAVCDVQRQHAERAKEKHFAKADIFEDYRKLLDRKDIEAVTIGTPDHWHTEIALAALDAGKHVYCEKPLTLTIDEGKQLVAAVKKTGKVMQVGTQQRGDQFALFGRAVATVRSGQLGKIKKVTVQLPLSTEEGGPFASQPVPDGLNWDFWLGQAPKVDYCPERSPLPLPLVVRVLRRHLHRLGRAPHGRRPLGARRARTPAR